MQYLKFLLEKLFLVIDKIKHFPYKKVSLLVALSTGTILISANAVLKDVKHPKIEWGSKKLEITVFQGTSRAVEYSFMSDKDLENIELELVPKLAKFATVKPSQMDNITAGQKNNTSLYFSIPQDTELGAYEGTLHLKQENKTIPQTLKIILNVTEPTADDIPFDEVSLPIADRIYEDQDSGAIYVKDEVVVRFKNDASQERIKEIISEINGKILGYISDIEIYQIYIPGASTSELEQIVTNLENYPEVIIASYHWIDKNNN